MPTGVKIAATPEQLAGVKYDADVLLFLVEQDGKGACHTGEYSCFHRRFGGE